MDFLEAHREVIEESLYHRLADLLNLDVDLVFYDTTSREHLDGKLVVHSNDDTLSSEEMALGYQQLQRVEEAWRTLKSGLRVRPVYHWTPHRICAHVSISVLALLLERVAEQACADTWGNIRDDLKQITLVQLLSPNGTVWQVTEPGPEALNRLQSLEDQQTPPLLRVD
jgi:transposase